MPRLTDIIAAVPAQHKKALLPKLKCKPVRTASGIAVVAVMCKPHRCPHIAMTGNICVSVTQFQPTLPNLALLQECDHDCLNPLMTSLVVSGDTPPCRHIQLEASRGRFLVLLGSCCF
jgi:hypothetical protein